MGTLDQRSEVSDAVASRQGDSEEAACNPRRHKAPRLRSWNSGSRGGEIGSVEMPGHTITSLTLPLLQQSDDPNPKLTISAATTTRKQLTALRFESEFVPCTASRHSPNCLCRGSSNIAAPLCR